MSNSTQNDWEMELLQALILDQPPVEVMFIKGVENLVRTCTWSQFVTVVDKFRADARKEVIAEIEKMKHNLNANIETKDIETQKICNRLEGYNLAIDDVLSTLREEEEPKKEKHGCCQCYCSMCRDMCFRSKCVVHTKEETK